MSGRRRYPGCSNGTSPRTMSWCLCRHGLDNGPHTGSNSQVQGLGTTTLHGRSGGRVTGSESLGPRKGEHRDVESHTEGGDLDSTTRSRTTGALLLSRVVPVTCNRKTSIGHVFIVVRQRGPTGPPSLSTRADPSTPQSVEPNLPPLFSRSPAGLKETPFL